MDDIRPDEVGIDARWTARISDDVQAQIAKAFPEMRLVWNDSIDKFQTVLRSDGCMTVFQDGTLMGWELVGEHAPPLDVDSILATMRGRQHFVAYRLREKGYGTENSSDADVLNAYLDDSDNIVEAFVDQLYDDAVDDYLDGPMARARDEEGVLRRSVKKWHDTHTKSRAHKTRKLVVPASSGDMRRLVGEQS